MHAALQHLEQQSHRRWAARPATLPDPPPARALIEAFLAEALPDDDESRTFHRVFTSCAVLAMTDPEFADQPFVAGPVRLTTQLTEVLQRARSNGEVRSEVDPAPEAARLLALNHGLGTSVLMGQRTAHDAEAVLRYHLDRVFEAPPAADHRTV